MVELGFRLIIAAAIFVASRVFGAPPADIAWQAGLAIAALGVIGQQIEANGAMNGGFAGLLAVADSLIIAMLVGSLGHLNTLGFLVLIPMLHAAMRRQAQASTMAPLAAASLFASYSMFAGNTTPKDIVLAQAAAVLATGLLVGNLTSRPFASNTLGRKPMRELPSDDLLELRDNYRSLKKAYQDLERRTKKPLRLVELDEVRAHRREEFFQNLARKLASIGGIQGVGVYALAQLENSMVIRGTTGDFGKRLSSASLTVKVHTALGLVRNQTKLALEALKDPEDGRHIANVMLMEGTGRMVGMLCLASNDEDRLDEARVRLEELAPTVAALIVDYNRREALQRRANQAELLYETASVTHGATTPLALAERVVEQLWELTEVDHVSLTILEGDHTKTLSTKGVGFKLLETMSFAKGSGVAAWRLMDSPELTAFDVRTDFRFSSANCLKQRLGSMCIVPIADDYGCLGYLAMATHRCGGVDAAEIETLRTVSVELGRAFAKLKAKEEAPEGMMTSSEFLGFVGENSSGCLVLLEPINMPRLEETFGRPALNHALRQLATRLRAKLPGGGALCRKPEGSFVAYLPQADKDMSSRWANDAAAIASLIGLRTPDGSSQIPLGLRAKVAEIHRQEDEIFTLEAS